MTAWCNASRRMEETGARISLGTGTDSLFFLYRFTHISLFVMGLDAPQYVKGILINETIFYLCLLDVLILSDLPSRIRNLCIRKPYSVCGGLGIRRKKFCLPSLADQANFIRLTKIYLQGKFYSAYQALPTRRTLFGLLSLAYQANFIPLTKPCLPGKLYLAYQALSLCPTGRTLVCTLNGKKEDFH